MSFCSIARALLELQQVNAAGLARLTNPTHPQIEQLCCGASPRSDPTGLVGVAREEPVPRSILQEPVSENFQLSLCFWSKCSWPRVPHTPSPKSSGPRKERAACRGRGKG